MWKRRLKVPPIAIFVFFRQMGKSDLPYLPATSPPASSTGIQEASRQEVSGKQASKAGTGACGAPDSPSRAVGTPSLDPVESSLAQELTKIPGIHEYILELIS